MTKKPLSSGDATEKRSTEACSIQQFEGLIDIVNNIPVGIFSATLQGVMVFCSQKFATILGYDSPLEILTSSKPLFHPDQKEASVLFQMLAEKGEVVNLPLGMAQKNGAPVLCAVTARTVSDRYGHNFLLDGLIKEIPKQRKPAHHPTGRDKMHFCIDLEGTLIRINSPAARLIGQPRHRLLHKPLTGILPPEYHDLISTTIHQIVCSGHQTIVTQILSHQKQAVQVELSAELVKGIRGHRPFIRGSIHPRLPLAAKNVSCIRNPVDRFQGAVEMAGGVAHQLNQPLTVINHTVEDLLGSVSSEERHYQKLSRLKHQVNEINAIAHKIKKIKKYALVEYVSNVKVIDLDRAC